MMSDALAKVSAIVMESLVQINQNADGDFQR